MFVFFGSKRNLETDFCYHWLPVVFPPFFVSNDLIAPQCFSGRKVLFRFLLEQKLIYFCISLFYLNNSLTPSQPNQNYNIYTNNQNNFRNFLLLCRPTTS
mmetsp:Transcript_15087/g.34787  ORF Transcript_15087/g.34787 Transcript_15087/m.34787 type:complete len:100 (+) Transcript_15087:433-732(+)